MHTIIELDRQAVLTSVEIVTHITTEDLARETPCGDWTLGDLLAHMTAQHRGFAASAQGVGADLAAWQVRPVGANTGKAYVDSAHQVIAAFGAEGAAEREFALPEFGPDVRVPGAQAIGFHFIDYVVHTWDVARSLGHDYVPNDALLAQARQISDAVPNGPERLQPGAAFKPSLATPEGATSWHQILSNLGRSPSWPE